MSEHRKTERTLKLIDGEFSAFDAAQVLLSLVKSKIDFHTLVRMSEQERLGRDVSNSEQRLVELNELQGTVRSLCHSASEAGQRLRVKGWIEITLVPAAGTPSVDASTS